MTKLPRPREDLGGFQAYRTQQMKADVRLQANEWAEPNRAGQWLTPQELNEVLLNRYPSGATDNSPIHRVGRCAARRLSVQKRGTLAL